MGGRLASMSRATALVFALLVFASGALAVAADPADAAKREPCWKRVHDDWSQDGRIDGVYSPSCIQEALKHLPEDARAYSDFESALGEARQDAVRRLQGGPSGDDAGGLRDVRGAEPRTDEQRGEGPFARALGRLGPEDSDSVPLPLLVLAALAGTLLIAGGAGLARRKLQARRPPAA